MTFCVAPSVGELSLEAVVVPFSSLPQFLLVHYTKHV